MKAYLACKYPSKEKIRNRKRVDSLAKQVGRYAFNAMLNEKIADGFVKKGEWRLW